MFVKLVLALFTVLIVTFLVLTVGDYVTNTKEREKVTVIEKFYQASSTSTGVGMLSSGDVGVMVSSKPAKYELVLEFSNGIRKLVETNEYTVLNTDENEVLIMTCMYGGWSSELFTCWR